MAPGLVAGMGIGPRPGLDRKIPLGDINLPEKPRRGEELDETPGGKTPEILDICLDEKEPDKLLG